MNKFLYYLIWAIAFIALNITTIPVAFFSLFASTTIFSIDGFLALLIILIPNIAIIQLWVSIRQQNIKFFVIGLILIMIEIASFLLLIYAYIFVLPVILFSVSLLLAITLLVLSFRKKVY
ncbi:MULTISPECIES: hypothetical protein [Bacillus]|uniref:hypothetical protein n=1 Tax=Bacillus TaxID=1386 RepID=UPI000375894C|nr:MULTISPECIES: hypothetical protein [Bacillus]